MKFEGHEVYDARSPVLLHIGKTDTSTGKPKDPGNCAAAKAACRVPGVLEARIYRTRSYLLHQNAKGKRYWKRYMTPQAIRGEMISLDRGSYFDPGDYKLNPASETSKLGASFQRTNTRGSSGQKKPRSKGHVIKGIRERGPGPRGK